MRSDVFLTTPAAVRLYESAAREMPIFDYHCHLNPREIYEDQPVDNIGELWLSGDHYKWRLMRAAGVPEELITGNAPMRDKFLAYAGALAGAVGNPLYHWSHMELSRYFGIEDTLSAGTAADIWDRANAVIRQTGMSPRKLIEGARVRYIGTTDDPVDTLEYHRLLAQEKGLGAMIRPAFRPDKALLPTAEYIQALGKAAGSPIRDLDGLKAALCARLDFFAANGCTIADCGIPRFPARAGDAAQANAVLKTVLSGGTPEPAALDAYLFYLMRFLAGEYRKRGIVMQLHLAVLRNVNPVMSAKLGPDTGYDIVGDPVPVGDLVRLFAAIEEDGGLPKTIVYALNPAMNETLASLIGAFQGGVPGRLQLGSAWWFCDHRDGIARQLKTAANYGHLGSFVGMLTDSRSFLSYARHDYFRRILCDVLGRWAENGEVADGPALEALVRDICYRNAERYFLPDGTAGL